MKNSIGAYFSTAEFIKAFCIAILLSVFILVEILGNLWAQFFSPFFSITGLYFLLIANKIRTFWIGFWIGILWFYWISFSLYYYEVAWAIPFEIVAIALVYALLFRILSFSNLILKSCAIIALSYIHPFGFNWLNLEITLIHGIFEPNLRGICAVFCAILAYIYMEKFGFNRAKFSAVFLLIFALQFSEKPFKMPNHAPLLITTFTPQDTKWDEQNYNAILEQNLRLIIQSIENGENFIVLPETAFPTAINKDRILYENLREISDKATIIVGGFYKEKDDYYNSAFLFENGKERHFNKVFLVPFGEEIPLPDFAKNFINKLFFNGANDIKSAKEFGEFMHENELFRSAICYEITMPKTYQTKANYIIAITNNAWFSLPNLRSSQSVLQRILIKYQASKFGKVVFHSVNGSKSEIITPKRKFFSQF
jgi:apolipoprotein N-acyltransferase